MFGTIRSTFPRRLSMESTDEFRGGECMRARFVTLGLIGAGFLTGCAANHKPYANNPLLLYYKPTLSDSETVLADRAARRGPTQPPMPALAADAPRDPTPGQLPKQPAKEPIVPVKFEAPAPPAAPTEIRPIIRQSSETSAPKSIEPPTAKLPFPQSPLYAELKPILVSAPASPPTVASLPEPTVAKKLDAVTAMSTDIKPVPLVIDPPKSPDLSTAKRTVPGPFGHDAGYHWLQGVVEKNDHGHYAIRYCDPSVDDEYGGKFVTDDPRLGVFHDGDIVGMEGALTADPAGKARHRTYTLREVWLVKAKP